MNLLTFSIRTECFFGKLVTMVVKLFAVCEIAVREDGKEEDGKEEEEGCPLDEFYFQRKSRKTH